MLRNHMCIITSVVISHETRNTLLTDQLQNDCDSQTQEENSCIYKGQDDGTW